MNEVALAASPVAITPRGQIKYYPEIYQGTEEWAALRCGMLTASEMKLIVTPTLKPASNEKERSHLYELLAQRVTGYVEPHYISDDMLRGREDEETARNLYIQHYDNAQQVGFVTNDKYGFMLGYSPDALVSDDGLIETKSRRQKYQVESIIEGMPDSVIPDEYALQIQTGLLVTERKWCDFITYSGGLPMATIRVYPDHVIMEAIIRAAAAFEGRLAEKLAKYRAILADKSARLIPTERTIVQEIIA